MADITVRRGKVGESDINTGESTFTRYSPTGTLETINQVNASSLPLLSATAALFSPTATDIDNAIELLRDDVTANNARFLPPIQWPFAVATALWEYTYTGFSFQDYNNYNRSSVAVTEGTSDVSTEANQITIYNKNNALYYRLESDGTIYPFAVLDEDDFATDATTQAPSQQSAAAYIQDLLFQQCSF